MRGYGHKADTWRRMNMLTLFKLKEMEVGQFGFNIDKFL